MANRGKNNADLPQVPKTMKSDGIDVEYSEELADLQDRVAALRAAEADKRAQAKRNQ